MFAVDRNGDRMSDDQSISLARLAKFILPSLVGIFIFLTPVTVDGNSTIVMGVIMGFARAPFEAILLEILVGFMCVTVIGAGYFLLRKPDWENSKPVLFAMFDTTLGWFLMRLLGAVIGLMVYFEVGPAVVRAADTGGVVFFVIGPGLFFTVLIACLFLPFLTDFGFLEFTGTLLRKPFEKLFTLPGRAAIDATSSLVAAASVGLLITLKQYNDGRYTAREAASVATNFSIVSLPFSLVIAATAKLDHIFFTWYLTVIGACLIAAAIMVRVKPLRAISDTYYAPVGKQIHEEREGDVSLINWATSQAVKRAEGAPSIPKLFQGGAIAAITTLAKVIGPGLAIATITSILVFHTSVFDIIAWPVYVVLDWMALPEAKLVAPGLLVGFLEQFTPAVVASGIDDERMRFILAGLSVSQLIYMSEVGVLILRSHLPLGFLDLVKIFALRTVILFPIFLVAGHLLI